MINLFRSVCFELKRDRFIIASIIIMCVLLIVSVIQFFNFSAADSESSGMVVLRNGSGYFTYLGDTAVLIAMIAVLGITSHISGSGFNDRTMNYEILYGVKRAKVYLVRVIASVLFSVLALLIFIAVPVMIITAVYGWGGAVEQSEAIKRYILFFVQAVRFSVFTVFMTFLLKNSYLSLVSGYMLFNIEIIIDLIRDEIFVLDKFADILSGVQMNKCMNFENYTFGFDGIREFVVYTDVLERNFTDVSVLSGIAGIIIFLLLGYVVFRKSDMH